MQFPWGQSVLNSFYCWVSRFLTRVVCRMWPKLDIAPLCTFYPGLGTARLRQKSRLPLPHAGPGKEEARISSAVDLRPDYLFPTQNCGSFGKEQYIRNVSYFRKSSTWKPRDMKIGRMCSSSVPGENVAGKIQRSAEFPGTSRTCSLSLSGWDLRCVDVWTPSLCPGWCRFHEDRVPSLFTDEPPAGKPAAKSLSCVWLFETPWPAAHQAPLSVGFSRQECWSGCHCLLRHESLEHGKCPMNPLSNESVVPFNLQKQPFVEQKSIIFLIFKTNTVLVRWNNFLRHIP